MERASRRLSVCVPDYRAPATVLLRSVRSAHQALPGGCELLVAPSDVEARSRLDELELPDSVRVLEANGTLDLVANWNRCIADSSGDLVHLLHDDDAVTVEFYDSVLELAERYPTAGLYGTWTGPLEAEDEIRSGARAHVPAALRASLRQRRGRVSADRRPARVRQRRPRAIRRRSPRALPTRVRVLPGRRGVSPLRRRGGLALTPAAYYREGVSETNARLATWSREDFVHVYVTSRLEGASHFPGETVQLARSSTLRRVLSIAMTLSLLGRRRDAAAMLGALRREDVQAAASWRLWVAYVVVHLRLAALVNLRRRFLRGSTQEAST